MAETAQPTAQQGAAPEVPKRRGRKLGWILVCVASMVAGAVAPIALGAHKMLGSAQPAKKTHAEKEQSTIVFGDVAVNLSEGRMTRYLRVKIVLLVDEEDVKDITKTLERRKPVMRDWLIGHLAGKSLKDVGGTVGIRRSQREIQERFEEMLYPGGEGKPIEVLFEEFVVQ